jgi:ATP-binding cassette subfamily C (CFTR/MRP) protein 4
MKGGIPRKGLIAHWQNSNVSSQIILVSNNFHYRINYSFIACRAASSKLTDERVKVMHEIVSGIRVIKMYGWEHAFRKLITKLRK